MSLEDNVDLESSFAVKSLISTTMGILGCPNQLNDTENIQQCIIAFVSSSTCQETFKRVMSILGNLIGEDNVYDLNTFKPESVLMSLKYSKERDLRIIVGGGDGTSAWILNAIDYCNKLESCAIATLPLGISNDLARHLNWGTEYLPDDLFLFVKNVRYGAFIKLDRWKVIVEPNGENNEWRIEHQLLKFPYDAFNISFCIGDDAERQLNFSRRRSYSSCKIRRVENKVATFHGYLKQVFSASKYFKSLADVLEIKCDDISINETIRNLSPDTILFLNTTVYNAGCHPWGSAREFTKERYLSKWRIPRCDDHLLEIIAFSNHNIPNLKLGGRGHRIGQCSKISIVTKTTLPMKMDGESILIGPVKITITLKNQARLIVNTRTSK